MSQTTQNMLPLHEMSEGKYEQCRHLKQSLMETTL